LPHSAPRGSLVERVLVIVAVLGSVAQIAPRVAALVERRSVIDAGRSIVVRQRVTHAESASALASWTDGSAGQEMLRNCVRRSRGRGCLAVVVISARLNRSDRRDSEGPRGRTNREGGLAGQDPTRAERVSGRAS